MVEKKLTRREFLGKTGQGVLGLAALGAMEGTRFPLPYLKNPKIANKVIVLGIDGMDPVLLRRFVAEGSMPTFKKLMELGHYCNLRTTLPPQSPVAWSSFITGTNPGGHGIFDFIHRDPDTFTPYLSTTRSFPTESSIDVGKWSIPLKGGQVELLRRGPAFWTFLEERGIPASLFKMPANFPVTDGSSVQFSGMGTPDLLGTYGTFTYYSDTEVPGAKDFTGGRVVRISLKDHKATAKLEGPQNSMRSDSAGTEIELKINRDPWSQVARLTLQGREIILKQGEWSEWVPLKFELMPMFASVGGMVRFYMQEVHPNFRLYLTPINVDPMNPTLPICNPAGYSRELSQAVGRFYTQGFPEDTKALSNGIFSNEEFFTLSKMILEKDIEIFDYQLRNFHEGLFFYYFSSIDQNTHMLWRTMDPSHPLYDPAASKEIKQALHYLYRRCDDVLRQTMNTLDSHSTLMLMSDHGFAPFSRELHLSTWLVENGFMAVTDRSKFHSSQFYQHVDWSKTKAYVMGLNGIYINLQGRDRRGSVPPHEAAKVKQEIMAKLRTLRDPMNGRPVITNAYDSLQVYSGPYLDLAPDIVIGYESGYRISDEAVLGKFPQGIVGDRTNPWAADHCMDPIHVPGILLTNKQVAHPTPALWDLAPTILKEFGFNTPKEMEGKPIFT